MKALKLLLPALAILTALAAPGFAIPIPPPPPDPGEKPQIRAKPEDNGGETYRQNLAAWEKEKTEYDANLAQWERKMQGRRDWLAERRKEFMELSERSKKAQEEATAKGFKIKDPGVRYADVLMPLPILGAIPVMMVCMGQNDCFNLMQCLSNPEICGNGHQKASEAVAASEADLQEQKDDKAQRDEEAAANIARIAGEEEKQRQQETKRMLANAKNKFTPTSQDGENQDQATASNDEGSGATTKSNDTPGRPDFASPGTESPAGQGAKDAPGVRKVGPELIAKIVADEVERMVSGTFASLEVVWSEGVVSFSEAGAADAELKGRAVGVPSAGPDNTPSIVTQQGSKIFDRARDSSQMSSADEKRGGAVRAVPLDNCPPGQKCG